MSENINDGGPAFPVVTEYSCKPGLSLRDWFAGQALVGLNANPAAAQLKLGDVPKLVKVAYIHADAMLKQRTSAGSEKGRGNG